MVAGPDCVMFQLPCRTWRRGSKGRIGILDLMSDHLVEEAVMSGPSLTAVENEQWLEVLQRVQVNTPQQQEQWPVVGAEKCRWWACRGRAKTRN